MTDPNRRLILMGGLAAAVANSAAASGILRASAVSSSCVPAGGVERLPNLESAKTFAPTVSAHTLSLDCSATPGDGGGGLFAQDPQDISSPPSGTTIVDSAGRRYKRTQIYTHTLEYYGARGDSKADDFPAFEKAFSDARNLGRMCLQLRPDKRYYVGGGSLEIPSLVTVRGAGLGGFTASNKTSRLDQIPGIVLGPSCSIKLGGASRLEGLGIVRAGLEGYENGTARFAGTAVQTKAGNDDQSLHDLIILGFSQAVLSSGSQRVLFENIRFDCLNGIRLLDSRDVSRIRHCHGWPWVTAGGSGRYINDRAGTAFELGGDSKEFVDWAMLEGNFAYGYRNGAVLNSVSNPVIRDGGFDHDPASPEFHNSTGVKVNAGVEYMRIDSITIATGLGVNIDLHPSSSIPVYLKGCIFRANFDRAVNLNQGILHAVNNSFADVPIGFYLANNNATTRLFVSGSSFSGTVKAPYKNGNGSANIFWSGDNVWEAADGTAPFSGTATAIRTLSASNGSLNVPTTGDMFFVDASSRTISAIHGGWPGRRVTIVFNGETSVLANAELLLKKNFVAQSRSALTMRAIDGSSWIPEYQP